MTSCTNTQHAAFDIPDININGINLPPDQIAREVQYHQSETPEQAIYKAAQALVIQQLLVTKAQQLGFDGNAVCAEDEAIEEATIRSLLENQATTVPPTQEDCQNYFAANRDKFRSPDLLEVSHILLAASQDDPDQRHRAKQSAEAVIAELQGNLKNFAALAKQYSACPSKETGGNLGQLTAGQTVPEFERQVFSLNQGLAKHPIESRYGYHVVLVERKIVGRRLEYSHVQEKISDYLAETRQRVAISNYIHKLIDEADIEGIELDKMAVQ